MGDQRFCFCCLLTDAPDSGDQLMIMQKDSFTSNNETVTFLSAYFDVNNCSLDDLPSIPASDVKICSLCAAQLESAYMFREMCRDVTKRLLAKYPKKQDSQNRTSSNNVYSRTRSGAKANPIINNVQKSSVTLTLARVVIPEIVESVPQKTVDLSALKCPTCSKYFQTVSALTDHKLTHPTGNTQIDRARQTPKNIVYGCQECPKVCHSMVALRCHQRDYHANKPTKCTTCSKVYPNRKTLDIHIRAVHKKNPYVCKICNKSFNHPVARLLHNNNVHLKVQPKCKKCQKKFKSTQSLALHIRMEHSSGQFTCDLCAAEFKFRNAIESHMQSMHLNKS